MNAQPRRGFDYAASRFRSSAMARRARQSARSSPAAVPIGDNGDVEAPSLTYGWLYGKNLSNVQLLHGHVLSPPRRTSRKQLCFTKCGRKIFFALNLRA
jgi:hypothetical protein